MTQAIGDPDELERFAQSLNQFIEALNEAVNGLNNSFDALGDTWKDEKRASFEEEYKAMTQQLSHFEDHVSQQIPYIQKMAERLRNYLES